MSPWEHGPRREKGPVPEHVSGRSLGPRQAKLLLDLETRRCSAQEQRAANLTIEFELSDWASATNDDLYASRVMSVAGTSQKYSRIK
jgi:hypothetical protein